MELLDMPPAVEISRLESNGRERLSVEAEAAEK